ncbi:MAG: hypothetical protein JJD97_10555, partial [Gemmatimonadaceae bacterium]|nr:hypothetical protein [Gemmatimonadaceae bacterium]
MIVRRARHRLLPILGLSLLTLAACQEKLAGGAACPTLCPGQQLEVHDTVLVATDVFDTTAVVTGMPPLGTETQLLVARYADAQGDSIVSSAVLRYDSLQRVFPRVDTTKPYVPITSVTAASLQFTSTPDTSMIRDSIRFEVFDADANVPDLDTATIHQLFVTRPTIGTLNVKKDSVAVLHIVPLDTAFVRLRVTTPGARIRLGLRLFSYGSGTTGNAQVGVIPLTSTSSTAGTSTGASLQYEGKATVGDTVDSLNFVNYAHSKSSGGPEFKYLANYQLVLKGTPPAPSGLLPVGGLPSNRVYLRFDLPSVLIDSSTTIVRATLLLHQLGDVAFSRTDSISLTPRVVIASSTVTDISKAALILATPTTVPLASVRVNPSQTRTDTLVLVSNSANLVTLWRAEGPRIMQRAIVLQSSGEGRDARRFL